MFNYYQIIIKKKINCLYHLGYGIDKMFGIIGLRVFIDLCCSSKFLYFTILHNNNTIGHKLNDR